MNQQVTCCNDCPMLYDELGLTNCQHPKATGSWVGDTTKMPIDCPLREEQITIYHQVIKTT